MMDALVAVAVYVVLAGLVLLVPLEQSRLTDFIPVDELFPRSSSTRQSPEDADEKE